MKKYGLILSVAVLLAGCRQYKKMPAGNLVYIQIGDSITFGSRNNGGNTPGDCAVQALATPTTYIKMGWPAESAEQFNLYRREQLLDSLASIPAGHRIVLGIAYGANDLPRQPPARVLANILRVARWAHDTAGVQQVLIIPVMNRKDKWGFTRTADGSTLYRFNEARLWVNRQLHARTQNLKGIRVGNEADSPKMYAESYPEDTVRCADQVHPWDQGARELGEGTIAHGIAGFGGIRLKESGVK